MMPPAPPYQTDQIFRTREVVVFTKSKTITVAIDSAMAAGGWPGGQGVQWVNSTTDNFTVTYSSGQWGGFLLYGSNESADQYTAMTGQQITYGYAVMVAGRGVISTLAYEQYTYASRHGGGPLVGLTYQPCQLLYFSLRGLWTLEDELALSGSPLAPALSTGVVCQLPKPVNEFFLGVQTTL